MLFLSSEVLVWNTWNQRTGSEPANQVHL